MKAPQPVGILGDFESLLQHEDGSWTLTLTRQKFIGDGLHYYNVRLNKEGAERVFSLFDSHKVAIAKSLSRGPEVWRVKRFSDGFDTKAVFGVYAVTDIDGARNRVLRAIDSSLAGPMMVSCVAQGNLFENSSIMPRRSSIRASEALRFKLFGHTGKMRIKTGSHISRENVRKGIISPIHATLTAG